MLMINRYFERRYLFEKIRRKWFQPNTNTSPASTFSKFTVFSNEYTSIKPNSAQTTTTTAEKSLKDILWEEIHQFKAKKLYAEALSCFSTIFEKNMLIIILFMN